MEYETKNKFLEEMSIVQEAVAKAFQAEKNEYRIARGMVMHMSIGICFQEKQGI